MDGLPRLLQPRVYHGRFGGAQFQSLYQPFHCWWFQVFTTFEYQALTASVWAAAALAIFSAPRAWAVGLPIAAVALAAATLAAAGAAGWHAVRVKKWGGRRALAGGTTVALLHVLQPLARAAGRFKGWRNARKQTFCDFHAEQKLWGNLSQREAWLDRLVEHLNDCGWAARAGGEWDRGDVLIDGPGPYRLHLTSVAEERLEKGYFFVRYRVEPTVKPSAVLLTAGLLALLAVIALKPFLLPLAVPLLIVLRVLAGARRAMTRAVSQLAVEIARARRMPKVVEEGC
jgi:hypothetical protein